MKKVDEGVELFDDTWDKVYTAEQQNQKEKYEMDLKKEIKKLQRLRDQIKTWIGSSDVKDKDHLIEARKLIETKMEQFKVCEKETKTKTYSKEGLARESRMDPHEQAKHETNIWIGDLVERLAQLVEDRDVEIERLMSGKGRKTNKNIIEQYQGYVLNHKYHISKLEGIMRLVNNDRLDVEAVNALQEDLDYYVDSYEDEEYQQQYDEEFFYESLGLDELDIVNVDRVTQAVAPKLPEAEEEDDQDTKDGKKDKKLKPKGAVGAIPLSIGRAKVATANEIPKVPEKPPAKIPQSSLHSSSNSVASSGNNSGPTLGPAPTPRPPTSVLAGGASMAAILKREGEQQEKKRQEEALQQQQLLREQQARQQAELLRQQQQLQLQHEEQLRQQEAIRQQQLQQQQLQAQQKVAEQEALKRQQLQEQQARQQQEAAVKQQLHQAQQVAQQKAQSLQQQQQQRPTQQGGALDILSSGLGSLSLGTLELRPDTNSSPLHNAVTPQQQLSGQVDANYLSAINESFAHMPTGADSERQRQYMPRNPYPTPGSYPGSPSPIFDNPAIFEKLGTDCLFFIFYYAQGTYQQYLAARELKKQSWRYHKKYMTWFQRHEEPKVTTDEYEQGTYVYFDYETGWCQRIKADFRFEYSFLEDSLQ